MSGRVVSRKAHNVIVQSEPYPGASGPVALTEAYPRFDPAPDVASYVGQYVAGAEIALMNRSAFAPRWFPRGTVQ